MKTISLSPEVAASLFFCREKLHLFLHSRAAPLMSPNIFSQELVESVCVCNYCGKAENSDDRMFTFQLPDLGGR